MNAGAVLSAVLLATSAAAQVPMPGYSPAAAARQRAMEERVIARPEPARAEEHARELSREPHVAGTPAQARTRDYVVRQMRGWGIDTEVRTYQVWLPHATSVEVWRVAPDTLQLPLVEPPIPGDPATLLPQFPTANGYSAPGEVTAEVVYVNYGLREDYRRLDSLGVPVRGRVVVARYGRSFRGIKAREAERHGAAALLLYSDPQDDGYVQGDVYPEGPMRPPRGVQRGSVFNGVGDPTTPGYPSRPGAPRIPLAESGVPRIPVVALSYAGAAELLRGVRGADVPQQWQGGLPFRYHAGPGPVAARVAVRTDAASGGYKPIWNTLGVVRGGEFPDELVVIGAHRDAWGAGAFDNASGTASVLEAARAVAAEVRAGRRPRRTVVFATWDAEEWGIIGSTEHVEDDSLRLQRGGVAYLNQDVAATGPLFGGGGSPSLRETLRSIARQVPDPGGEGSVYQAWRRARPVPDSLEPAMGDPGGGSDFAGFYNHLGIPHLDWSFRGAGGVYHSAYDTHQWMRRFGDPGFVRHAAAARIGAATALRLANAEILPYDYVEFARTLQRHLPALEETLRDAGTRVPADSLRAALLRMEDEALRFARARDAALVGGAPPRRTLRAVNSALLRVERALTRPEGLRTRPWYRNLIYAADEDNGYSNVVFPSVVEAARGGDAALAAREMADLVRRMAAATAALREARARLPAPGDQAGARTGSRSVAGGGQGALRAGRGDHGR